MASQLAAWQTSVAAVRAFVGEERWPRTRCCTLGAVAAALDLDRPRPSIVVSAPATAALPHAPADRCAAETVVALLDDVVSEAPAATRSEAPDHLDGSRRRSSPARRGGPDGAPRAPRTARALALARRYDALEGLAAVRAAALLRAPVERIVARASGKAAPPSKKQHRDGVFDPHAFGVAAKALGDAGAWRDALRGVCATRVLNNGGPRPRLRQTIRIGAVDFDVAAADCSDSSPR